MICVNARFSSRQITGVERYTGEISKRLAHNVHFLRPNRPLGGLFGHLWEQLVLPLRLSKGALLWSPANTGPILISRQVVTIHDISVIEYPKWFHPFFAAWYAWLLPRLARCALKVITGSKFSRKRIIERLGVPDGKVIVVPGGSSPVFRPVPEEQQSIVRRKYRLSRQYFLSVGTLEPRKNIRRLLLAWEEIYAQAPEIELVVVGKYGKVFRDPQLGRLPTGTRWLGYIPDKDLPSLYAGAIAYLLPSHYEGFGLTGLEAMACGSPVIASQATALPEVIGEAGIYVNPNKVEDIAQAMKKLLWDEELRQRLSSIGLARARNFSWDRAAQETWQVLCRAIDA